MRSRVCFDAVHSDRLRLLIEYGMLTGLHYFGGYRGSHIVFLFSLLASGPWSEIDDIESWDRWGHLCRCFDTFILGHAPILACWLWLFIHVRRHSVSPSNVMDIKVWVRPAFSSVSSYSRVLLGSDPRSDSGYSLTQQGCIPYSLSYSLVRMSRSSMMYSRVFIKIFEFQMYTLGHIPYQFLWILDVVD